MSLAAAVEYGWVNRAIPDSELDGFVENLARRIASFEKVAIAAIKASLNERAVLPDNQQLMDSQTRFFQSLATAPVQTRIKNLLGKGLHQPGDVELNLGKYL